MQTCGGIPSTQIPNNSFGYGRVDASGRGQCGGDINSDTDPGDTNPNTAGNRDAHSDSSDANPHTAAAHSHTSAPNAYSNIHTT